MASPWNLHLHLHRTPLSFLHPRWGSKSWISAQYVPLRTEFGVNSVNLPPDRSRMARRFRLRAADGLASVGEEKRSEQVVVEDTVMVANGVEDAVVVKSVDDTVVVKSVEDVVVVDSKDPVAKLQEMIISSPPIVFMMKRYTGSNLTIMCCIATTFLVMVVRVYVARKARYSRPPGSVADLVRRGQLRSDRRGITSSPLKYEDPFNNPLVKFGKSNSTVEMCGKVYRLAPVTLTKEEQSIHQKRRSRAYQWKRPTIFLKEGDSIPPDVDPDTIRWIPANHPFATTASEIDEDLAQNNVHQKHGVPFRIKAEHEALQRKLEGLQSDQKLNKLVIDPTYAKDFERPFKSRVKSHEQGEQGGINNKGGNSMPSKPDHTPNSS